MATAKPAPPPDPAAASAAGASGAHESAASGTSGGAGGKQEEFKTGNIFFDNPGTFAGLFMAAIIAYFYHNKKGGDSRIAAIAEIDDEAAVSPREIRQLREDNNISLERYDALVAASLERFPGGQRMAYTDFNDMLLKHLFVDGQVVHYGHHLERVLKFLQTKHDPETEGLDARVLLVALSLGVKAKAKDRFPALFRIFASDGGTVSYADFLVCVAALQDTFQLPSEFQVAMVEKYPFPRWERMDAGQLAAGAVQSVASAGSDGPVDVNTLELDVEQFTALLKSRDICAWGECFEAKKKRKKKKKKKQASGGADEATSEAAAAALAAEQEEAARLAQDEKFGFQPASSFEGAKPGFVFKLGDEGLGYYPDAAEVLKARDAGVLPSLAAEDETSA